MTIKSKMHNQINKVSNKIKLTKKTSTKQKSSNSSPANVNEAPSLWIEAGHFYSPITYDAKFQHFDTRDGLPGINLNKNEQVNELKKMATYYHEIPFEDHKNNITRYYYINDQFSYSDAVALYSILRLKKPNRVVEVGSGYSSALMLDVNNLFLENKMKLTFVEPYPTRLKSLLLKSDKEAVEIVEKPVQKVDLSIFKALNKGDILFVDSSHVSKAGSDVNWIYFEILPILKKGVLVHIHDVMYPLEYSDDWIKQGRSWNEIYLLRAFLMYNTCYKIVFWPNYLHKFEKKKIQGLLPLAKKNTGGSIWLEKLN